ncbi:MAG: hypothetical protein SFT94_08720 [Pseudanabaenaceae cyanobacterium bins.68]|nr:hypothetical protein [Pseudanabaenaceae cyanobacterium bins.68]
MSDFNLNQSRLLRFAEDQLTEYSTVERKVEKLRRKIGLTVPPREQSLALTALETELRPGGLPQLVAEQRQAAALPFWGVGGLALLAAASLEQPLALIPGISFMVGAVLIQKWGWDLQAKLLLLRTLSEMKN